jgi:cytochrome c oxidase assembly protein subunit 11
MQPDHHDTDGADPAAGRPSGPRVGALRAGTWATLLGLLAAVAIMVTLVSFSVTLYRLFCSATGALGTTQRAAADTAAESARVVTVKFITSVAPGLPWRFRPVQEQVRVRLGQDTLVVFEAENLSDHPIVGHATFNVSPGKSGKYFKKIECFCFTEERLDPHQKVEMPVDFFVDPRLGTDRNTNDITEIDLSYEFFQSRRPAGAQDLARFEAAPPDPVAGRKIFATACAECHELDRSKIGPPLAGVFNRKAGAVPGYPYSAALARSGIIWSATNLDKWLAGPRAFVPGAGMPMGLPDALRRRDVIAYLKGLTTAPPSHSHQAGL